MVTVAILIGRKERDTNGNHYPYRYKLEIKGLTGGNADIVEERINAMGGTLAKVDPAGNKAVVQSKKIRTKKAFKDALAGTGCSVTDLEEII